MVFYVQASSLSLLSSLGHQLAAVSHFSKDGNDKADVVHIKNNFANVLTSSSSVTVLAPVSDHKVSSD